MDERSIADVVDRPCPFLDRDDPRCAGRFSLRRLGMMFGYCMGQPQACPTYHRLTREMPERADPEPAIPLTIDGCPVAMRRVAVDAA